MRALLQFSQHPPWWTPTRTCCFTAGGLKISRSHFNVILESYKHVGCCESSGVYFFRMSLVNLNHREETLSVSDLKKMFAVAHEDVSTDLAATTAHLSPRHKLRSPVNSSEVCSVAVIERWLGRLKSSTSDSVEATREVVNSICIRMELAQKLKEMGRPNDAFHEFMSVASDCSEIRTVRKDLLKEDQENLKSLVEKQCSAYCRAVDCGASESERAMVFSKARELMRRSRMVIPDESPIRLIVKQTGEKVKSTKVAKYQAPKLRPKVTIKTKIPAVSSKGFSSLSYGVLPILEMSSSTESMSAKL